MPGEKRALSNPARGLFVGRQQELQELGIALQEVLTGQGRLAMLVGEAGIGKTRTAREFAAAAEQQGAQSLWGRCYENPGAPPFWPWVEIIRAYAQERAADQLLAEMGAGATDIAGIVPEVRERLPGLAAPPPLESPEQARFRLFDSVTSFLSTAARVQPLVLILDNLHWADKPSLLLLEFLARELEKSRLLVVGTYRDVELSRAHPLSETLGELTREVTVRRILLRGLRREDADRLMLAAAGRPSDPWLVEAVYRQTEGNPLFMTEVVRLLLQEGVLPPHPSSPIRQPRPTTGASLQIGIPEGVREVIGKRLNRLSNHCNQTLTHAAVIGRGFGLKEVAYLLDGASEEQVLEALEEAVAARIIEELPQAVGQYQFTHALIRETLYDELTIARRVRLHRRTGEALEALYRQDVEPHLARLAYHFSEAAPEGGVEEAITYAVQAGERANALLAYEEAARHYELALRALERREPVDEARRCALLLALGTAQRKAGQAHLAVATLQRAADLASRLGAAGELARAALELEQTAYRSWLSPEPAVRLLEEALAQLGEGEIGLRARLLGRLSKAFLLSGRPQQAATTAQRAIQMARRASDPIALALAIQSMMHVPWTPEETEQRLGYSTEMMRLAEAAGDLELVSMARAWRLLCLLELGDVAAVDIEIEALSRVDQALRQPQYQFVTTGYRAMRSLLAGGFEEAEQLALQALMLGRRAQVAHADGLFGIHMFTLRREQGRLRELEPVVRGFLQRHAATSTWRPGLALIYAELGLEREARAEFEHLAQERFTDIPRDGRWLTCITYLVEVCAYLADPMRATTLYELLRPYSGRSIVFGDGVVCYGSASRYLGLLATAMRQWEEAEGHFEEAAAMNARMGARPWLAHTQHDYAVMLLARQRPGDRERADPLRHQALAIARELGMYALEQRIVTRMNPPVTPSKAVRTYPNDLSQREIDVLRLMAAGKSNREIADSLFISLNTVATHVRNILTKTNSANRTEAAAYAMRHGLTSAAGG
jgi:predicted ATPase/DNA-binding CsgD family transcriptional regulator